MGADLRVSMLLSWHMSQFCCLSYLIYTCYIFQAKTADLQTELEGCTAAEARAVTAMSAAVTAAEEVMTCYLLSPMGYVCLVDCSGTDLG